MSRKEITCKLTGARGLGVDAHVIPESFFLFSKEHRKPTNIIPLDSSSKRIRSPKGIYDQEILVEDGERYFSDCDRYANDLLITRGKNAKAYHDGKRLYAMELFEYDYRLLKLFAISLLWRASVSSDSFFKGVRLGSRHEDTLRNRILNQDPGDLDDYSTILAFYEDVPETGFGLLSPWSQRREKVRFYQFQLAYWIMFVKADQKGCPEGLRDIALSPITPFRAINLGSYLKSKTFRETILPNLHSRDIFANRGMG